MPSFASVATLLLSLQLACGFVARVAVGTSSQSARTMRSRAVAMTTPDEVVLGGTKIDASGGLGRRPALRRLLLSSGGAASILTMVPLSARAGVGEGDSLPDGAKQFDRVRKAQLDWGRLEQRFAKMKSDETVSDAEWANFGPLLVRMVDLGEDMNFMSRGLDKSKRATADKLVKDLQNLLYGCVTTEVRTKDLSGLRSKLFPASSGYLNDFLALFQDVPDEL